MKYTKNNVTIDINIPDIVDGCYYAMVHDSANGECHIYDDGTLSYDTFTQGTYIQEYMIFRISQNMAANSDIGRDDIFSPEEWEKWQKWCGENNHEESDWSHQKLEKPNDILDYDETYEDRLRETILGEPYDMEENYDDDIEEALYEAGWEKSAKNNS